MTSSSTSGKTETQGAMKWMYGGAASILDRERYLLGQSVDKNFEMYAKEHDVGPVTQLNSVLDRRAGTKSKSGFVSNVDHEARLNRSLIGLETVRKEDPLVAIRLKEEAAKEEAVNNPMHKLKLQMLIKKTMEKKVRKMLRKQAKAERKAAKKSRKHNRSRSSSSSSSSATPPKRSRHDSPAPVKGAHRSSSSSHHKHVRGTSPSPDRRRSSHRSDRRSPDRVGRKHTSSSSRRSASRSPEQGRMRGPAAMPPKIEHDDGSDSDEARRRQKFAGFGLVKNKDASESTRSASHNLPTYKPAQSRTTTITNAHKATHRRAKLTEEDKASRLAQMASGNVEWRDAQRTTNLSRVAAMDREEDERNAHGSRHEGVDFLRPMLDRSAESSTLTDTLQRKRATLQRSGDSMSKSFVRR